MVDIVHNCLWNSSRVAFFPPDGLPLLDASPGSGDSLFSREKKLVRRKWDTLQVVDFS
jgi:hypothetical protein